MSMNMSLKALDADIVSFLESRHIFVLSTEHQGQPYSAPLFYIFLNAGVPALVFASSPETRHMVEAAENARAAGAVYVDTRSVAQIQGVQCTGRVVSAALDSNAVERYTTAFPEIMSIGAPLWRLEIDFLKYTDNRISFAHKRIWQR
ncbi:MAG: pyridoxamine 5'-phosphate oxidase family protein [Spirochaetia bacterium]|nr:pyridoxamine 5'-phosphate oxidase family protein [Spirochaetia bacterium]